MKICKLHLKDIGVFDDEEIEFKAVLDAFEEYQNVSDEKRPFRFIFAK